MCICTFVYSKLLRLGLELEQGVGEDIFVQVGIVGVGIGEVQPLRADEIKMRTTL